MSAQRIRSLTLPFALVLATATLAGASLAVASPMAEPPSQCPCNVGLPGGPGPAGQLAARGKLRVRITGANNGKDVTNGDVAGIGRFTATGAITDRGTSVVYRTVKGALISLRFVNAGRNGTITFLVKIDTNVGTSRWTIGSGTRAYRGLRGKGTERENADYTVSILTGTVAAGPSS